jgi:hypothetical protein
MINNGYVIIKFKGRYGNHLFMYFIARIYAEKNNLKLISGVKNTYFKIRKAIIDKHFLNKNINKFKKYEITDKDYNNNTNSLPFYGPGIYTFNGYFQNENFFYLNRNKILNYVNNEINKKNICVLHVRLDDYFYKNKRHLIINHNYYIDCIKKYCDEYDKIYIICDKLRHNWEKKHMNNIIEKIKLLNKIPIYNQQSIKDDIQQIINSKCIITSNSTFCFWASFFSKAEKIISFPYTGIDVLPNKKIRIWKNNPIIFKYNKDNKFIFNNDFSKNIINYFENI